jgi:hypothetical protein
VDANLIQVAWDRVARRHPKPKNIEFIAADLMNMKDERTKRLWQQIRDECTILTMFFVEDGLQKLKPFFETYLTGTKVKIVTIGYPMRGWQSSWEEVVLDLRIHLYQMNHDDSEDRIDAYDTLSASAPFEDDDMSTAGMIPLDEQFVPHEQKGPPLQILEYDPNEDVDYHWDDFDNDPVLESADTTTKKV